MKDIKSSQTGSLQQDTMKIPALGEILDYARRIGWRRALFRGAYVATNQLLALSIFDCFLLRREDINTALTRTDGGYECRFLSPDEAGLFTGQLDGPLAWILPEDLARGAAAYVILDGERLAGIGLYTESPTSILNDLVVHFDPPSRYMYRGYTQVAYRGRRLHALGILRAAQEYFDQQVPQLVTVCERTNYPAMVSVLRMGWQRSGVLYRIGVGPWTWLGQTAAARAIGMRLRLRCPETSV